MTTTTAAPVSRVRVTWTDIMWVAWRQHRQVLLVTAVLVLLGTAMMLGLAQLMVGAGDTGIPPFFDSALGPAQPLILAVTGYGVWIAAFWGAPLLSREYEQRTHLLMWSQDVSPVRWLAGKAVVFLATATVFALMLGTAAQLLMHTANDGVSMAPFNLFSTENFEATPLVQVGYAFFGFALGLMISAITRRTVLSIGLTIAGYIFIRGMIFAWVRPYYQPPVRAAAPLESMSWRYPEHVLAVDSGLLNTAGRPMETPMECVSGGFTSSDEYYACLRSHGVAQEYQDFQPGDRIAHFQLVEFGIFMLLSAALLLITWRMMLRITRL